MEEVAPKLSLIEQLLDALNITGEGLRIASGIILSLAVILICGFLMTRLTKLLKLPSVTAYIVVGILIGPSVINLIPQDFISRTDFLSDIALAFIAFTVGEYFKLNVIKKGIAKAIVITILEALATFALVLTLCIFAFRFSVAFSLVLAALASATAPTSTIMTIKQTQSKGHYVTTLLEVIVVDSIISLLLFTIGISVCVGISGGNALTFGDVAWPLCKMLICLVIGVAFGFALRFLINSKRTTDNRLIIVIAVLLLFCGVCSLFGQSPLLGGIAIGMVYNNMTKEGENDKVFAQVNYWIPPVLLVFFVRSGMKLDFSVFAGSSTLTTVPFIVIVLCFLVARFSGKYGGSFLGGLITKQPKETRNYLGFGLIPQASVAIGLATLGSRTLIANGMEEEATAMLAIILASSILFELAGPALAKFGLYLSHSYGQEEPQLVENKEKATEPTSEEDPKLAPLEANEEAFNEAAEKYNDE